MSLFGPRALRWSLVELCRRTEQEGWERLLAAEAAGGGVALVTGPGADWVVAARALAAWAGPLHLSLPDGAADRELARRLCSGSGDGPRLAADPAAVERALAAGEKVLMVSPATTPRSATAVLRVLVERRPGRRYRLVFADAGS